MPVVLSFNSHSVSQLTCSWLEICRFNPMKQSKQASEALRPSQTEVSRFLSFSVSLSLPFVTSASEWTRWAIVGSDECPLIKLHIQHQLPSPKNEWKNGPSTASIDWSAIWVGMCVRVRGVLAMPKRNEPWMFFLGTVLQSEATVLNPMMIYDTHVFLKQFLIILACHNDYIMLWIDPMINRPWWVSGPHYGDDSDDLGGPRARHRQSSSMSLQQTKCRPIRGGFSSDLSS